MNQIEESYDIFEEIISELDFKKIDDGSLKIALKKVLKDTRDDINFEDEDFQDLCKSLFSHDDKTCICGIEINDCSCSNKEGNRLK